MIIIIEIATITLSMLASCVASVLCALCHDEPFSRAHNSGQAGLDRSGDSSPGDVPAVLVIVTISRLFSD